MSVTSATVDIPLVSGNAMMVTAKQPIQNSGLFQIDFTIQAVTQMATVSSTINVIDSVSIHYYMTRQRR